MTSDTLSVLLSETLIGNVTRDRRGRLRFAYEPAWRTAADAIPLSLSMPLASTEHAQEPIEAFMWGLLPDNQQVLDRWARRFHVSPRSPFALLSHVGEDCAGAVQFVVPERVRQLTEGGSEEVRWLSEHDVANRLRSLRSDHSTGRMADDTGQFSLAGAQAKTALLLEDGRWGIPSGRTPTTHILKPPIAGFDGHVENEHVCLALARELGLPAASSEVKTFEDETAIVVERYDRYRTESAPEVPGTLLRLHQEDFCQALGLPPTQKYQSDHGPTPEMMAALLRTHSDRPVDDVAVFVDALLFNWLIAGTDAHAKNYSVLLGTQGQTRLAPLYDLASALPYPQMDQRRLKLAMKIGSTYEIRRIAARHVERLATEMGLDPSRTVSRARELTERMPDAVNTVCDEEKRNGLTPRVVDHLRARLLAHADQCSKALETPTA